MEIFVIVLMMNGQENVSALCAELGAVLTALCRTGYFPLSRMRRFAQWLYPCEVPELQP